MEEQGHERRNAGSEGRETRKWKGMLSSPPVRNVVNPAKVWISRTDRKELCPAFYVLKIHGVSNRGHWKGIHSHWNVFGMDSFQWQWDFSDGFVILMTGVLPLCVFSSLARVWLRSLVFVESSFLLNWFLYITFLPSISLIFFFLSSVLCWFEIYFASPSSLS